MVTITVDADKYRELQILAMENLRNQFDKYRNPVLCANVIDKAVKLGMPNLFINELIKDLKAM